MIWPQKARSVVLNKNVMVGVVGVVVVWPTLFGTGNFGDGLTLDQCLGSSTTAKEMHMCKSQHLAEYTQWYPTTEG